MIMWIRSASAPGDHPAAMVTAVSDRGHNQESSPITRSDGLHSKGQG